MIFHVASLGCARNLVDSESMTARLLAAGHEATEDPAGADMIVVNTCSVRDLSEQKVWSMLGRLGVAKRAERRDLVVGVLGCMAEREGENILARMPHVDLLCGPSNLDEVPRLIDEARAGKDGTA